MNRTISEEFRKVEAAVTDTTGRARQPTMRADRHRRGPGGRRRRREMAASIAEITRQVTGASQSASGAKQEAERQRPRRQPGLRRRAHRRDRPPDHRHRQPDQPARAQRDDRGGTRGRGRQGLRRGGLRGEDAGQPDRRSTEEIAAQIAQVQSAWTAPPRRSAASSAHPADRRGDQRHRLGGRGAERRLAQHVRSMQSAAQAGARRVQQHGRHHGSSRGPRRPRGGRGILARPGGADRAGLPPGGPWRRMAAHRTGCLMTDTDPARCPPRRFSASTPAAPSRGRGAEGRDGAGGALQPWVNASRR